MYSYALQYNFYYILYCLPIAMCGSDLHKAHPVFSHTFQLEQERVSGNLQSHTDAEREMLERRQREYEEREAERRQDTP